MMDVSDMTCRGQLQRLHDVCGETNKVFRGCHVVIHDTLSLFALDASAKPFREFGLNQQPHSAAAAAGGGEQKDLSGNLTYQGRVCLLSFSLCVYVYKKDNIAFVTFEQGHASSLQVKAYKAVFLFPTFPEGHNSSL